MNRHTKYVRASILGCFLLLPGLCFAQSMATPGMSMSAPSGLTENQATSAPSNASSSSGAGLAASAEGCQADIQKLGEKRMSYIAKINNIGKANKGKLDPVAACPQFKLLVKAEKEMLAYMNKNKEWCSVPDNVISSFSEAVDKDSKMAGQACKFAAQVERAKKQQSLGMQGAMPAVKLPSGPL